ncbi:cation:proton antiporter [Aliidiomarina sp. Khilg15.8]
MHSATLLLLVLSVGLASQWLAWRLKLPSIVVLIAAGLTLGPITGVIQLTLPEAELSELIGFGVAIILFEGGMDLKVRELRSAGHGIGRLTVLGAPLAWALGSLAAHYLAGLSWPVSLVMGAILVVTGPTVILPLVRQARLNKESASLLKWEGIVNDPVGVLLAVLTFQYFTISGEGVLDTFGSLGLAVLVAVALGGVGGWLIGWVFRRGWVPEDLKPAILMVLVLVVFWASNIVQHESGLLTVTLMGMVLGNMKLVERDLLVHFKENLSVILLSVLFIIIPSQLKMSQLEFIDWRAGLFVLAILLLVRPLTVALVTINAQMRKEDKLLLGWIAPRGIVAAATASIFGPSLVDAGYPDAERLLPLVFLIIMVTVLVHGLSLGILTRRLGLAARRANGVLVIGANAWTHAFAHTLQELKVECLVIDGSYERLKPIRMDGIAVYYGEILSEHAEHELEIKHLSYLLSATDNDFYNALVCKSLGPEFGYHRTLQLATHKESNKEEKQMTMQQRGHTAFAPGFHFQHLHRLLDEGWTIQVSELTEQFDMHTLNDKLGTPGKDWLLLASLAEDGSFKLITEELGKLPDTEGKVIYFAPQDEHLTSDKD